jgi:hypothetical protein
MPERRATSEYPHTGEQVESNFRKSQTCIALAKNKMVRQGRLKSAT